MCREGEKHPLVIWAVVMLIIGIPTYFMGCHPVIGGYCGGYIIQNVKIIKNNCHYNHQECLKGIYTTHDNNYTCDIVNNVYCTSKNQCLIKYRKQYPLDSYTTMYINKLGHAKTDDLCRTPHYVQSLSIVGLVFLIFALILIIFELFYILKLYLNRRQNQNRNQELLRNQNINTHINTHIKLTKYVKINNIINNEICSVCLEPFIQNTLYLKFTCSHEFHEQCIKDWNLINCHCPICNRDIGYIDNLI